MCWGTSAEKIADSGFLRFVRIAHQNRLSEIKYRTAPVDTRGTVNAFANAIATRFASRAAMPERRVRRIPAVGPDGWRKNPRIAHPKLETQATNRTTKNNCTAGTTITYLKTRFTRTAKSRARRARDRVRTHPCSYTARYQTFRRGS